MEFDDDIDHPQAVAAAPLPTTRAELRAFLAADNARLQGQRDWLVGATTKRVQGAGARLMAAGDGPAERIVNALLDEWLALLRG